MTQVAAGQALGVELFGINADCQVFRRTQNLFDPTAWSDWAEFGGTLRPSVAPHTAPVVVSPGNLSTVAGAQVNIGLSAPGGTLPYTWTVSGLPTRDSISIHPKPRPRPNHRHQRAYPTTTIPRRRPRRPHANIGTGTGRRARACYGMERRLIRCRGIETASVRCPSSPHTEE
jgi:hypothetical protein